MIGASGSGKSSMLLTVAPHQIVSLDQLRAVVSEPGDQTATADALLLQHQILTMRLRRGLTTFIDNVSCESHHLAPTGRPRPRPRTPRGRSPDGRAAESLPGTELEQARPPAGTGGRPARAAPHGPLRPRTPSPRGLRRDPPPPNRTLTLPTTAPRPRACQARRRGAVVRGAAARPTPDLLEAPTMADTLRTHLARTALDTAESAATVTAAAATGLTTYRALHHRPAETRLTLALATGALAAVLTDHHAYKALAPLRRRLGAEHRGAVREPVPAPTPGQLAADLRSDAAHRAAAGAGRLDYGQGSLTKAANWMGQPDGSARCELSFGAHLLAVPRPADRDGYSSRSYLLVTSADATPVEVHSITDLVALLDSPAAASRSPPTRTATRGTPSAGTWPSPNSAPPAREPAARTPSTTRTPGPTRPTTSTRKPTPTPPALSDAPNPSRTGAAPPTGPSPRAPHRPPPPGSARTSTGRADLSKKTPPMTTTATPRRPAPGLAAADCSPPHPTSSCARAPPDRPTCPTSSRPGRARRCAGPTPPETSNMPARSGSGPTSVVLARGQQR
ncbi:hypothetical protein ACFQ1I_46155 [Kitasatospora arboriphila]